MIKFDVPCGPLADQYSISAYFNDVTDPAKRDGQYTAAILTGCAIAEEPGSLTDIHLVFDHSTGEYANHPPLWVNAGIDPKEPAASSVEFEGRNYNVGGSFEWDGRALKHGVLKGFVFQQPTDRLRDQDLLGSRRLSGLLAYAIGGSAVAFLNCDPTLSDYYYSVRSPHLSSGMGKPFPLVQHLTRVYAALQTNKAA